MLRALVLVISLAAISTAYADPPPLVARDLVVATTRSWPAIERCHARAGLVAAPIAARVVISPSGRVRKVRLEPDTPRAVVRCVTGIVLRWRFHPSGDGVSAWIRLAGDAGA